MKSKGLWFAACALATLVGVFAYWLIVAEGRGAGSGDLSEAPVRAAKVTITTPAIPDQGPPIGSRAFVPPALTRVLRGKVVDEQARGVGGVTVAALNENGHKSSDVQCDGQGMFRIEVPAGTGVDLWVRHAGFEDALHAVPAGDSEVGDIVIGLVPGGSISGCVGMSSGASVSGDTWVSVEPADLPFDLKFPDLQRSGDLRARMVKAEADGTYALHGLPLNRMWRVRATQPGWFAGRPAKFAQTGDKGVELVLKPVFVFALRYVDESDSTIPTSPMLGEERGVTVVGLPDTMDIPFPELSYGEVLASGVAPPPFRSHGHMYCSYYVGEEDVDVLTTDIRVSASVPGYELIRASASVFRASPSEIRWNTVTLRRLTEGFGGLRVSFASGRSDSSRAEIGDFCDRSMTTLWLRTQSHGGGERAYSLELRDEQLFSVEGVPSGEYSISTNSWPYQAPACRCSPDRIRIFDGQFTEVEIHPEPATSITLAVSAPGSPPDRLYGGPLLVRMWRSEPRPSELAAVSFRGAPFTLKWIPHDVKFVSVLPSWHFKGPYAESERVEVALAPGSHSDLRISLRPMP